MAQEVWKMAKITLNGTGLPFDSVTLDPALEAMILNNGSAINPKYLANRRQLAVCSGTSPAVATALGLVGLVATKVSAPCVITMVKWDGVAIASGDVHKTVTINAGLIENRGIECADESANASLAFSIHASWDGTNLPFVVAEGVAAPSETALEEAFVIGPCIANSVTYELNSFQYDPKAEIRKVSGNGMPYASRVDCMKSEPTFSLGSTDVNLLPDLTSVGSLQSSVKVYLRKVDPGGGRVANATAEHIEFTLVRALAQPMAFSGAGGNAIAGGLSLVCRDESATAAVVVDTTAAIP